MPESAPQEHIHEPSFVGRHLMIAGAVEAMDDLDLWHLRWLQRVPPTRLRALREHLLPDGPAIEEKKVDEKIIVLSKAQEAQLLKEFTSKRNSNNPGERYEAECALKTLLDAFEPLLDAFANKLAPNESDQDDLKQDARLKLLEMSETYNPERGRFVTFALLGIFQEMLRGVKYREPKLIQNADGETVEKDYCINYSPLSTPSNILSITVQRIRNILEGKLSKLDYGRMATALETDAQALEERLKNGDDLNFAELKAVSGIVDKTTRGSLLTILALIHGFEKIDVDTIASDNRNPEEELALKETREWLEHSLKSLTLSEETTLRMTTGLLGEGAIDLNSSNRNGESEPDEIDMLEIYSAGLVQGLNSDDKYDNDYTMEEIAEKASVTREKVRQSISRALRRMRHPSRARYLYVD